MILIVKLVVKIDGPSHWRSVIQTRNIHTNAMNDIEFSFVIGHFVKKLSIGVFRPLCEKT